MKQSRVNCQARDEKTVSKRQETMEESMGPTSQAGGNTPGINEKNHVLINLIKFSVSIKVYLSH